MSPKFINCLGASDNVFTVNAGGHIILTCIYFGIPLPSLQCVLLDANGMRSMNATPKTVTRNCTSEIPMIIYNISQNTKEVMCTAFHVKTGKVKQKRSVSVLVVLGKFDALLCFLFVLS